LLHLIKLAVGIRDIPHLEAIQRGRASLNPPLRHQTRHIPKRAEDILNGGSIYWVISGLIQARQRIIGIEPDIWDDGSKCCGLHLDPALIRVEPRAKKAFQGWRYLEPADASPDLGAATMATEATDMPDSMRRALTALALL
jgi:hypothetical protein